MASFNSASSRAFFFALSSSPPARENTLAGFSLSEPGSLGIMAMSGSLPSLLSPGIAVALADLSKARAPEGPLETLRLSRSLESTRSNVFSLSFLAATGRFAGAPGFGLGLETDPGFALLSLGCDWTTGPPSLRLIESQSSGSLAEKLEQGVSSATLSSGTQLWPYNGTIMSTQKSRSGSELALSAFCVCSPSGRNCDSAKALVSSDMVVCQMQRRSA